jgi:putative inorganic carbon (HCO3(-)) transporter
MEVMQSSVIGTLLLALWHWGERAYDKSVLAVIFRAIATGWKRAWYGSGLVTFSRREGALPKAWRFSIFCRTLTVLFNLPVILLHWVYDKGKVLFEHSVMAQLAFAMGDQTNVVIAWLIGAFLMVPYDYWSNSFSLEGFILVGLLFTVGGMRRKSLRIDMENIGPYPVFFAVAVILAQVFSVVPEESTRYLMFHITCMLCVLFTVSCVEKLEQLVRLMAGGVTGLFAASAYGIFQAIQGVKVDPLLTDVSVNENAAGRVYSIFDNPNAFAHVLVLLIPLGLGLMFLSRTWRGRFGAAVSLLMGVLALGLTYSRASWIAFVIAMMVFVFLWRRKLLPVLIFLGAACIPLLPSTIISRLLTIFNTQDTSTTSRFPLYQAGIRLIERSPIMGAGLGAEAVKYYIAQNDLYSGTMYLVHLHNIFLEVWAETGLLGIVSFMAGVLYHFKIACKIAASKCPYALRMIVMACAASLVGIMVCGLADYIWHYPRVMLVFWFVFAITLSSLKLARKQEGI